MDGFGNHSFKWLSPDNKVYYIRYHLKSDQGIAGLDNIKAAVIRGYDPDYATRDLYNTINRGEYPSWTMYVQIMTPKQAANYKYDILDPTKYIFEEDFPLIRVGKLLLNQVPQNFFA